MNSDEFTGELIEGATLTFYSNIVERDLFDNSHKEIRQNLLEILSKYLDSIGLRATFESRSRGVDLLVEKKENQPEKIEKWIVICSFLERRGMGRNGKPYLMDYRILTTFRPIVRKEFKNISTYTKDILRDSVRILDDIGQGFNVEIFAQPIEFSLLVLDQEIETGTWKVTVAQENATDISKLITKDGAWDAIKNIDATCRNRFIQKNIDCLFLDNVPAGIRSSISKYLGYTGFNFVSSTYDPNNLLYSISNGQRSRPCVVVTHFIRDKSNDEYLDWKLKFTSRGIPTQNILDISNPAHLQTVKLEILHKLGLRPLELEPSEEPSEANGYLYLSRVNEWLEQSDEGWEKYKDILGAVVVYGERPGESEEVILAINDPVSRERNHSEPDDNTDLYDNEVFYNTENVAKALSGGLSLKGLDLNIILTKRIPFDKIDSLVRNLRNYGIGIQKIFYMSRRYSTSPSDPERTEDTSPTTLISYKILSNRHLFYQPSQRLLGQYDLGTVYVEMIYPLTKSIEEDDVTSIIRLSKRRLYRLYNIPSLRIPEPVLIFSDKHNLIAELAKTNRTFPIRLLI